MRKIIQARGAFMMAAAAAVITLGSCNKNIPDPVPNTYPTQTGTSIGDIVNTNPNFTFLKAAVVRAGLLPALSDNSRTYTVFAPDNAAFTASGISEAAINALPLTQLVPLLQYHVVPQKVMSTQIPGTFPNLQYPSLLNPAPSISALLRLTTFPSTRNGAWVNNIPIKAVNTEASNGVIHTVGAVVAPPGRFLWDRINTDANLTYLRAAILRADSGIASTNASSLVNILNNIGANLTVFAPRDAEFRATLTALITQVLVRQGVPLATAQAQAAALAATPAVFSNPALFGALTAQTVRGVVVYHVFTNRAFTNNFPTTATNYPTVLNTVVANHPGLGLTATFTPPSPFASAATVKGLVNATAANIFINNLPEPNGTSDQHYLNGVLHVINQVLLPQPL
jgi:uncharacterized surface protein with fasciclin (FAS1) repeats